MEWQWFDGRTQQDSRYAILSIKKCKRIEENKYLEATILIVDDGIPDCLETNGDDS